MTRRYSIVDMAEVLLLELEQLQQSGFHFLIHHSYHTTADSTPCGAGEEITAVHLVYRGRTTLIPLPLSLMLVFECLARHRHIPRSATQMTDTFDHHGSSTFMV